MLIHIHTYFAVDTIVASNTVASVSVHYISTSATILTRHADTIVDVYKILSFHVVLSGIACNFLA